MGVSRKQPRSLSRIRSLGYASGNFGKNILWNSLEFCLLFILTDILGIAPALAGTLVMVSIVWDAILDPLFGCFADRVRTRLGKYGPFLIFGAPLCSLFYLLLFSIPLWPVEEKLLPMMVALLLFRTFYTVVDLPHNALIACITPSSRERASLAGMRYLFSALASICIAMALGPILDSQGSEAINFFNFACVVAVLSTGALWISWWSVRHLDIAAAQTDLPVRRPFARMFGLFKNPPFRILITVAVVTGLATPVFTKLFIFYSKYNLGNKSLASTGLTAFTVASALGVPFWMWLSSRLDKSRALQAAHLMLIAACSLFFVVHPSTTVHLVILAGFTGIASGGIYMMIWGLAPDVIDFGEVKSGIRVEAIAFSLLILSMKTSIGLGTGLVGFLMDIGGYVPDAVQTPKTLVWIRSIMCGIPLAGSLLAAISLSFYRIGHLEHAEIIDTLKAQRGKTLR